MRTRTHVISCAVMASAFLVVLATESAFAQTRRMTTQELTERATVVAVGKVTEMRSEWNKDRTRIYTHVTISVDQYIKGERSQKDLTITHLGGEIGEVGELYSGTPRFRTGEEIMVFVKEDKLGKLRVAGGTQGKYTITEDRITGQKMVSEGRSLEEFHTEIRSFLK